MAQSLGYTWARSMPAENCCFELSQALGSKLSLPGNATYLATQNSYFSQQEANLSPTCIVVPVTPQDVAEAVSIMSGIESCGFAIKGQTHAPAAGFANINAGVTIDMTKLNSVEVNADHTVASVGAGASWLEVYQYLDKLGLSVAGGRNGAVGVAGLTLGGGISYFAPQVGWACDNAVNFEIVLAHGKLVNANSASYPEIFRALKGGANNFGIVTRLDLMAFPQGQITAGKLKQNITDRAAVFSAFANIAGAADYDQYASLVTGFVFVSAVKAWSTSTTAIYTKPVINPPVYNEFIAIPNSQNTFQITNLGILANETAPPRRNWLFYTSTFSVSAGLLNEIFDIYNATIYDFGVPNGIIWSIAFEPLPTVVMQYGALKGGNSLGTSPKDGNAVVVLVAGIWPDTASNDLVHKTAQKMVKDGNEMARAKGMLHKFQYINYADPSQHPIHSYGEENVGLLRETSRKYDPDGIFQRQVPGGFKLGLHY